MVDQLFELLDAQGFLFELSTQNLILLLQCCSRCRHGGIIQQANSRCTVIQPLVALQTRDIEAAHIQGKTAVIWNSQTSTIIDGDLKNVVPINGGLVSLMRTLERVEFEKSGK